MNTGIQDAYNLAWKIALVLRGSAAPRLLDTYNEERLPNARRLLQTTDRMFNLAAGKDWLLNLIRTTIFPPMAKFILGIEAVRKRFFPLISQIGISYRDSSLSLQKGADHFKVRAGDRMPYFLWDGHSVYDHLRAPKFHLVTFTDKHAGETPSSVNPELLDQLVIPLSDDIEEKFGADKPFSVLLRPDNYIAFITADDSRSALENYLRNNLGQRAEQRSSPTDAEARP